MQHTLTLPKSVTLVAVSKRQSPKDILKLIEEGVTDFGENYVQELIEKSNLGVFSGCTVHFIGQIQSKKCADIVKYADVIHSVSRIKVVDALEKACQTQNKKVDIFIQVNLAAEEGKAGCMEKELPALIQHVNSTTPHLNVIGLMTFPPKGQGAPFYKRLNALSKQFKLPCLSMGTSDDYESAIEAGATHVRLGSVLFGGRG